jgi:hypothetical protein
MPSVLLCGDDVPPLARHRRALVTSPVPPKILVSAGRLIATQRVSGLTHDCEFRGRAERYETVRPGAPGLNDYASQHLS